MKTGTVRTLSTFGWLFLFAFLAIGVSEAVVPPWSIGSIFGSAFFGFAFIFWSRMGFQTLKKWFDTTTAVVAMGLLGAAFCFLLYVMWLGKRA